MRSISAPAICAAVVKCDAYGLGLGPVARRLSEEGCTNFFVALPQEAISLRDSLKSLRRTHSIYILNGMNDDFRDICDDSVAPVLNSLEEIKLWQTFREQVGSGLPAIVNFDTGMNRLGLGRDETEQVLANAMTISPKYVNMIMSHLACADDPTHQKNQDQLDRFSNLIKVVGNRFKYSLANSPGVFLGSRFHFDMVRPGAALYGIGCNSKDRKKLSQVVELKSEIIQTRSVTTDETIGYGSDGRVDRPSRLATVALGYGDGLFRKLGNSGMGFISGRAVPVIGRVSMDLVTLDVTDVPETLCKKGDWVEFIGKHQSPDDLAVSAGTIGYEILTALGSRYRKGYVGTIS